MANQLSTNKEYAEDLQDGFSQIGFSESDIFLEDTQDFYDDLYEDY